MRAARNRCTFPLALLLLLDAAGATSADDRCRSVILSRGTSLFTFQQSLAARCRVSALEHDDSSSNCPSDRDFDRIDVALARTTRDLAAACAPPPAPAVYYCVTSAADEALDLALDVFAVAPWPGLDRVRRRCRIAVGAQAVRFSAVKARKLAACNKAVLDGAAGAGPAGAACDGAGGTQAAIAAARARLEDKLSRLCGGPDGTPGTADDPDPQNDLGFPAACPGEPYCTAPLDTVDDLVSCAACIASNEADQLARGLAVLPLDAAASCTVGAKRAIYELFLDRLRDMSDCEQRIIDGRQTGPCPDAETADDAAVSHTDYAQAIAEACGTLVDQSEVSYWSSLAQSLADSLISLSHPLQGEEPNSGLRRCRLELANSSDYASGDYAGASARALRTCHTERTCGQTSAPCPDGEAAAKIATAAVRLANGIHDRCDAYTPAILGFPATCPGSGLPTSTIDEMIACLTTRVDLVLGFLDSLAPM